MLLAIDTSTAQIGLAVYDGSQVIAESAWRASQRHTVELAPSISELLQHCGLSMHDITAVGVALGPGSFTSLRVGLSLAKGIVFARKIPLIGITTLDILAQAQALSDLSLICAIQAGRGRFAVGVYKSNGTKWQAEGPARVENLEALMDVVASSSILCGEFSAEDIQRIKNKHVQLLSPANSVRRPGILAELAWKRMQAGDVDDVASLAPIYLHTEGTPPL